MVGVQYLFISNTKVADSIDNENENEDENYPVKLCLISR